MKRLLTALLALGLTAAMALVAFGYTEDEIYYTRKVATGEVIISSSQAFKQNLENTNIMFDQLRTAPTWLFDQLKNQGSGATMTLEAEYYTLTFMADDVGALITGPRYNLDLTLRTKNLLEYEKYFGLRTPKYELNLADDTALPTSKVEVHLPVGRFLPYSTYQVYKVIGPYSYVLVHTDLEVPSDGSVTFDLTEGGTYLLTQGKVGEHETSFRKFPTIEELRNMPLQ